MVRGEGKRGYVLRVPQKFRATLIKNHYAPGPEIASTLTRSKRSGFTVAISLSEKKNSRLRES